MPFYIELNTDNIVTGVLDLGQATTELGTFVETPTFMIDHFGDRYLGDHTAYEDKWEIMEKPIIPELPEVEPLVQVLDEFQTLQSQVNTLKKELAQAHEENKMLQEMSQSALGELLLIQAQEQQLKGVFNMPLFIADRIVNGQYDYATVMKLSLFAKYKRQVDEILIADGHENLIVAL